MISGAAAPIIAEGNLSVTKVVISSWVVASVMIVRRMLFAEASTNCARAVS